MKLFSYLLILTFGCVANAFPNKNILTKNWGWTGSRPKFDHFESSFESNNESIENRNWDSEEGESYSGSYSNSASNSDSGSYSHSDSSDSDVSDSESYNDSDSDDHSDSADQEHSFSLENSNEHNKGHKEFKGEKIIGFDSNDLKWHKAEEKEYSKLINKNEQHQSEENDDWEEWDNQYDKKEKKGEYPKKFKGHKNNKSFNSFESDWSDSWSPIKNDWNEQISPSLTIEKEWNIPGEKNGPEVISPWEITGHGNWNEPKNKGCSWRKPNEEKEWKNERQGLGWNKPGGYNSPWEPNEKHWKKPGQQNSGWRTPNENEWKGPRWHEQSIPWEQKENNHFEPKKPANTWEWPHKNKGNEWYGPKGGKWGNWKEPSQNNWNGPKKNNRQYDSNDQNRSEDDLSAPDESQEINWNKPGPQLAQDPKNFKDLGQRYIPYDSEPKDQEKLSKKKRKTKKKKGKKSKNKKAQDGSVNNEYDQPDENQKDKDKSASSPDTADDAPKLSKSSVLADYTNGDDLNKGSDTNFPDDKQSTNDKVDNPSGNISDKGLPDTNLAEDKLYGEGNIENPSGDNSEKNGVASDTGDEQSADSKKDNKNVAEANPYEVENPVSGKGNDIKSHIPKVKIIIDDAHSKKSEDTQPDEIHDQSDSVDSTNNAAYS